MNKWNHTLSVKGIFHNDELSIQEKRDFIVGKAKRLHKYRFPEDEDLEELIGELELVETVEEFDSIWSEFYDWADNNRVWVETV